MDWEAIRKEYESTDITMKDLADKHGVKSSTLRSRKNREKWQRNEENNVATKKATQRKSVATRKVTQSTKEVLQETSLEDWEEVYCLEYLKHFNMTKAYQRARPSTTYESARVLGSKTFAKLNVQERLSELKEAQKRDLYIDSLDIKNQWVKQAFADVNDYVDFGVEDVELVDEYQQPIYDSAGNPKTVKRSFLQFKNKEDIDGTLIKEIRMGKDGPVVQLYDKQKAMQELLKLMDHGGNTNGGVIFLDSKEEMENYLRERGETDGD